MLSPVMLLVWNGEELAFLVESPVCCGAAQLSPTPSRWERDPPPPGLPPLPQVAGLGDGLP